MDLAVGSIFEGKVTGITKFGAFVSLPEGKSGMVHISEIANSFVSDIKDHLADGQMVTVKIIGIDQVGRINLSIKKAQQPAEGGAPAQAAQMVPPRRAAAPRARGPQRQAAPPRDPATMTFEDKLKSFMADSESRMADIRHSNDRKSGSRRRK